MARTPRDYKVEYRRRIERGHLKGLSTSQARGHRLANERGLSNRPPRPLGEHALQVALHELRKQGNIAKAAKSIRISKERLRRVALEKGLIERGRRSWAIAENVPREFRIFSDNRAVTVILGNFSEASMAGRYMSAVGQFLNSNRLALLKPFQGHGVTDLNGKFHPFETDPNRLFRLNLAGDRAFENVYRIVI